MSAERAALRRMKRPGTRAEAIARLNFARHLVAARDDRQADHISEALKTIERAIRILDRQGDAGTLAEALNLKSFALREKATGDRFENYSLALEALERAEEVVPFNAPALWAMTLTNRAVCLIEHPGGEPQERYETARSLLQRTLSVRDRYANPSEWAFTQANLGLVLLRLTPATDADAIDLVERACDAYSAAGTSFPPTSYEAALCRLNACAAQLRHARLRAEASALRGLGGADYDPGDHESIVWTEFTVATGLANLAQVNPLAAELDPELARTMNQPLTSDRQRLAEVGNNLSLLIEAALAQSNGIRVRAVLLKVELLEFSKARSESLQERIELLEIARSLTPPQTNSVERLRVSTSLGQLYGESNRWMEAALALEEAVVTTEFVLEGSSTDESRLDVLHRLANTERLLAFTQLKSDKRVEAVLSLERSRARLNPAAGRLDFAELAGLGTAARPLVYLFTAPTGSAALLVWSDENGPHITSRWGSLTGAEAIARLTSFNNTGPKWANL